MSDKTKEFIKQLEMIEELRQEYLKEHPPVEQPPTFWEWIQERLETHQNNEIQ